MISVTDITIKRFEHNTKDQVEAYLNYLHGMINEGRIIVKIGDGTDSRRISGNIEYIQKRFIPELNRRPDTQYHNAYCSVNVYNKFKDKKVSEMNFNNLYCFDNLMFAFETDDENTFGREKFFVESFIEYCKKKEIALPNAFSYTGDGGVHIYYRLKPCYPNLNKAIYALKNMMAIEFNNFVKEYFDLNNLEYYIEPRVLEEKGFDRIPGSMNTHSGTMCEFFVIDGMPTYTYQMLLDFQQDEIDDLRWDKIAQAAQHVFKYGKHKNYKIDYSKYKKNAPCNKNQDKIGQGREKLVNMLNRRINGFFELADAGYDYFGYEQPALFAMSRFCKTNNMPYEEEYETLNRLNERFTCPLNDNDIYTIIDNQSFKKYRNQTLAENIGLRDTDEIFINAFHISTKTVPEYGMKKDRRNKAESYIAIAKYMKNHRDATNQEISNNTGYSIDKVKRAAAKFRKSETDLENWSKTTLDDYEFITGYFSDDYNKMVKRRGLDKKEEDDEHMKMVKALNLLLISEPEFNIDDVIHSCGKFTRQYVGMVQQSKKTNSKDPKNDSYISLLGSCKLVSNSYISTFNKSSNKDLFEEVDISDYHKNKINNGFLHYSKELLNSIGSKVNNLSIPESNTNLVCNDPIMLIPDFKVSDVFLYSPDTIEYHYFDVYNNKKESPVPNCYTKAYNEYDYYKKLFYAERNNYKYALKTYNFYNIKKFAKTAIGFLEQMNRVIHNYNEHIKNNNIDFDSVKINKYLKKQFIAKSIKEKNSLKSA